MVLRLICHSVAPGSDAVTADKTSRLTARLVLIAPRQVLL